jgi:hypothetical protein
LVSTPARASPASAWSADRPWLRVRGLGLYPHRRGELHERLQIVFRGVSEIIASTAR